ncbi:hypothetical protein BW730_09675 [Tessaracoccus aquimaris]|uniref:DUF5979 domain-containing protein n=1 Tax=Tessaracoccus aquimaris TaxID=1332264 RepID=A0A1Q2CNN0_9ACTN|nr:DUF5979 domain-containing protein [Tessaracoccus aquimaris]AQP47718.1 hypothetical protein BW730_09675 [Tessaracoccus aquimaris]
MTNTFEVGSVEVTKVIDGSGAEFLHPDTQFQLQLACEADVDGERLPVALDDDGLRTISPATGLSARFDELPVGAECTLTESDNGGAVATAITPERITVGGEAARSTVGGEAARITVTNTFEAASLEVSKVVTTSALDAAGEPVDHGPFGFTVACHYLDRPVVAEGFTAGEPMRISLSDGQSRTLTGLVAGTACEITEDAAANLASVESTWRAQDAEVEADGTTAQGVLIADVEGAATNAVAFRNAFRTSKLAISKVVEGPGAALYSTDAFLVDVTCVDDSGREVWHDSLPFGGEHGYEAKITDLWADATCSLSEPVSGGATSVEFSPADTVELSPEAAARVEVVNHFDLGEVAIHKLLEGPGAPSVPGDATFVVSLECSADVDGERTAIDLPDGGRVTLSRAGGLDAVVSDLPQGATCTATETETGGADASRITPERIVVGDDAGFTVINTFQTSPTPPTPGPTPQGPDTQTGVGVGGDRPFGPLIGAAVAASVAVAGLMMARRRRGA